MRVTDIFIGYLLFDAWIGNTDRHHENWGVVVTENGTIELAPTFDHASSLGRNESDADRRERMNTKDQARSIQAYGRKARSALYKAPKDLRPLSTTDAFVEAGRLHLPAGNFWLEKLHDVPDERIREVIRQVPQPLMSQEAADFAKQLLDVNKSRLLGLKW